MAIPPPPPPPMGGLKLAPTGNGKAGGDNRNELLQSIQKGAKLKKTVTVDKSGPMLAGKVTNSTSPTSATSPVRSITNNGSGSGVGTAGSNGMPKLGGIFEGLSSMPKLKPVGGRSKCCQQPIDLTD